MSVKKFRNLSCAYEQYCDYIELFDRVMYRLGIFKHSGWCGTGEYNSDNVCNGLKNE